MDSFVLKQNIVSGSLHFVESFDVPYLKNLFFLHFGPFIIIVSNFFVVL
jgi:hypothetical protein